MPCYDPPYPEIDYKCLVPLLCEAMQLHDDNGAVKKLSKELRGWWKKHKKEDAIRLRGEIELAKKEKDKAKAIKKLTRYEKKLLGFD